MRLSVLLNKTTNQSTANKSTYIQYFRGFKQVVNVR